MKRHRRHDEGEPQALNLADVPIQTTLLGGGLGLISLLLYVGPWRREGLSS